jgi:hypothetical protein
VSAQPLPIGDPAATRREAVPKATERAAVHRVLNGALTQTGWVATLIGALWLTAVLAVVWPALRHPVFVSNSNIDSAFFAYAGDLLRRGGTPYVTFWDHKPPLVYFIDAVALTISGGAVWGIWLVSLAMLLLSLVLAHLALRRAFGAVPAALGVSVFAFTLPSMLASNLTEEYALPLQWGCVLVLSRWATARPQPVWRPTKDFFRSGFALGVLGGLAFALKANLVAAPLSVAMVIGVALLIERRIAAAARLVGGAIAGAAIVWGCIVAYVIARGAFDPFMDQVFHYNFLYVGTTWGQRFRAAISGMESASRFSSLAIPLAAWALSVVVVARGLVSRADRGATFALRAFGLVWLPMEVLFASVSGRPYLHYFVVLLPPLAYLTASFGSEIIDAPVLGRVTPSSRRRAGTALVLGLAAAVAVASVLTTGMQLRDRASSSAGADSTSGSSTNRRLQIDETAAYVRAHTRAGAPLLVWGHASDVYLFAQRPPASRYVYSLALLTPHYADAAMVDHFITELRASSPPLIIDATTGLDRAERLVPSLGHWNPAWRYPTDQGPRVRWWSMTPELRAFYDYVASTYAVVDSVGPMRWPIYQRRDLTATSTASTPIARAGDAAPNP